MEQEKYEIVKFVDNGFELEVNVSPSEETVWLTQSQMADLFQKARTTIVEHIKNAYAEGELADGTMRKVGKTDFSTKPTNYYNLDDFPIVFMRIDNNSHQRVAFELAAFSAHRMPSMAALTIPPA